MSLLQEIQIMWSFVDIWLAASGFICGLS